MLLPTIGHESNVCSSCSSSVFVLKNIRRVVAVLAPVQYRSLACCFSGSATLPSLALYTVLYLNIKYSHFSLSKLLVKQSYNYFVHDFAALYVVQDSLILFEIKTFVYRHNLFKRQNMGSLSHTVKSRVLAPLV